LIFFFFDQTDYESNKNTTIHNINRIHKNVLAPINRHVTDFLLLRVTAVQHDSACFQVRPVVSLHIHKTVS